ncbi:VOC family protein [Methylocapsa sp. S129]|uniref:VOC family protein n=1 Tax=Methylocapsa sp. S129 TaxID=1641869 RepID=UPI00131E4BF7|nr:VOC family protein [Methylocapsa sp. S129]
MSINRIQSVYTVVRDMDRLQAFYETALGLPLAFRDRDAWLQFKIGQTAFALSSLVEGAVGARGGVVVFETAEPTSLAERIVQLGGRRLGDRDMGAHGRVMTFADPEDNRFQLYARADAATAQR